MLASEVYFPESSQDLLDLIKRMPGRDRSLGIYRRGDVLGMASLLEPHFRHPASGLAITAARVLELSSEEILGIVRENSIGYAVFLQRIANEVARKRQNAAGLLDGPGFKPGARSPRRAGGSIEAPSCCETPGT